MRILAVDIGTGTQDVFLFDSRLNIENGLKLVLPSPTMIVQGRIRAATQARSAIALIGRQMGGGPAAWAVEAHARAGLPVYATADAAITLDDDLEKVAARGIRIISEDEVRRLKRTIVRIEFRDFDFPAISAALARFDVSLVGLDAVAVAVFDHGSAPPGVSDRQFRFDYLDRRIRERNDLSAFAYLSTKVPPIMSRLQAVAGSGRGLDCPLVVMDTAPAAVLGATFDPVVGRRERRLMVNVGNFHALAFRLSGNTIEGLFEHHTGEIDLPKLEALLRALADGSLRHQDVFNDMGHGALVYGTEPLELGDGDYDVFVTGPRRSLFSSVPENEGPTFPGDRRPLRPYFAVPFGDMMLSGCFGLLAATAGVLPQLAGQINDSVHGARRTYSAPWDLD
jgi:uncharacterized protein (DUF1786 family)